MHDGGPLSGNAPAIQWYPGHIAKAEKALHEALGKVDLVIEVRDARIPLATGHPRLQRWISGKQHLLVLNPGSTWCSPQRARPGAPGFAAGSSRCGGAMPRPAPASSSCSRRRSAPAMPSTRGAAAAA